MAALDLASKELTGPLLLRGFLWQLGACLLIPAAFLFSHGKDVATPVTFIFGLLLPLLLTALWYLPLLVSLIWSKRLALALRASLFFMLLFSSTALYLVWYGQTQMGNSTAAVHGGE